MLTLLSGSIAGLALVGLLTWVTRAHVADISGSATDSALTLLAGLAVVLPLTGAPLWTEDHWLAAGGLFVVVGLLSSTVVTTSGLSPLRRLRLRRAAAFQRPAGRAVLLDLGQGTHGFRGDDDATDVFTAALVDAFAVDGAAFYTLNRAADTFEQDSLGGTVHAPVRIRVSSVLDDAVVIRPAAGEPSCSQIIARVQAGGGCVGLIILESRRGAVVDDSDTALLVALATQVALAFQNADYVQRIADQQLEIAALCRRIEAEGIGQRMEVRPTSQFAEIVGSSAPLQRALAMAESAAIGEAPIVITGETGTGKELVARAIHRLRPGRHGPLITVNCPAIPPDLAESDLFGHERGAFTGAVASRPGKFELADGGTIFLDEVADLPLNVQAKLLRVLQEHETQRLGSSKVRKLNLRIVAATNRDLQAEIRAHRFREDLYFRLTAVQIEVPPLRERIEDIPMLVGCFLERAAAAYHRPATRVDGRAMERLCSYGWPGNVRELKNVVERAVLLCPGEVIGVDHLPKVEPGGDLLPALRNALRDEKVRRIENALVETGGNQAAAARLLGTSRSNLFRMMKNLGMRPSGY